MNLPLPTRSTSGPDRLPTRTARNAAITGGLAYASAVAGYALLRRLIGDREGWLELIDDLEPWAYLPAPAVAAAGGLAGSKSVAAAGLAVCGLFGLRWGRRYLRGRQRFPGERPAAPLTVMTFNTLAWQREGHDLEHSILSAAPDIVALQEIGPRAANYLATSLGHLFPFHCIAESADSSGAAVLSRYPLREVTAFKTTTTEKAHWWQQMIVEAPAGPITLFNVHTKIPYIRTTHRRKWLPRFPRAFHSERRRREVEHLVSLVEQVDGPVIVCGDFNMTERSPDHRLMTGVLQDAYQAVGRGLGNTFPRVGSWPRIFPAPWPVLRLDYVWHSRHFGAAWAYRGEAGRSDHHPIIVGLRWAEDARPLNPAVPLAASAV